MRAAFILLGLFFIMLTFRSKHNAHISHTESIQKKGAFYKGAR